MAFSFVLHTLFLFVFTILCWIQKLISQELSWNFPESISTTLETFNAKVNKSPYLGLCYKSSALLPAFDHVCNKGTGSKQVFGQIPSKPTTSLIYTIVDGIFDEEAYKKTRAGIEDHIDTLFLFDSSFRRSRKIRHRLLRPRLGNNVLPFVFVNNANLVCSQTNLDFCSSIHLHTLTQFYAIFEIRKTICSSLCFEESMSMLKRRQCRFLLAISVL